MEKKSKLKWKNVVALIISIFLLIMLIISIIHIIRWKIDSNKTHEQIIEIQDQVTIEEIPDSTDTEVIEQIEEIPKWNPYWDYIQMSMIDVNFNDLKTINNQVKGWIQVNGTNINYPFVQADNNEYYLTHSFNKSWNNAGWVFLDYRNNLQNEEKNTIIYAHGRMDTIMFSSLRKVLSNGWLNNSNNYIVKLSTEYENTLWQVFSVYHIPTTSDYIQTNFSNDEEFLELANILLNRSAYNFNSTISKDDRILTLSTCYNDTDKVVLHAKLIKKESKR